MPTSPHHLSAAQLLINFISRNEKKLAVIIAALFFILAQVHIDAKIFLGDAGYYWDLSPYILDMEFPKAYRGYFYPMLLAPARFLFDTIPTIGYSAFYVSQAFLFSFALTILLPGVFTDLIGGRASLLRRLFVPAAVAFFFPGLVAYPLSDLPAICLVITSFSLALSAAKQKSIFLSVALITLSGFSAYGAYNTRTIYLFTTIMLVLFIPIIILSGKK